MHNRTGADTFAGTSRAIIGQILPLYRLYFPAISSLVEYEDYWSDRLVTSVTREKRVTEWVTTTEIVPLKDFAERWKHQCAGAEQKAKSFATEETFSSELLMDRVISVIEEEIPYRAILAKFAQRVNTQPILVLSRAAARLSRQLAQAGLVLATNFRSHVLRNLKSKEVRIRDGLVIELSGTVFGCEVKGKGDAPLYIEIARIPGAGDAVLHYLTRGRPFLVKSAGATDQGYFLTTSNGSKLSDLAFADDALAVLGYGGSAANRSPNASILIRSTWNALQNSSRPGRRNAPITPLKNWPNARKNNMKRRCETPLSPVTTTPASMLLQQAKLEATLWGAEPGTIETSFSVWNSFLCLNGFCGDPPVPTSFFDRVEHELDYGRLPTSGTPILWPTSGDDPSSINSRVRDLVRAGRSLCETSFSEALRRCLKASGLKYEEVTQKLGIPVEKLYAWLARNDGFVADMSPEGAKLLDGILGAKRQIFSVFAAMTQHLASDPIKSAKAQILGETSFGNLLQKLRVQSGLKKGEIIQRVEEKTGLSIYQTRLAMWEMGIGHPCEEMGPVITALDEIYNASHSLLDKWQEGGPRHSRTEYSVRFADWPERAKAQWKELDKFQKNRKRMAVEKAPAAEFPRKMKVRRGWSREASAEILKAFSEGFFGFLETEKSFSREELSLSLLCQWGLVQAYFDFVRSRCGRKLHGVYQKNIAKELMSLYRAFMRFLVRDIAAEAHWAKLPFSGTEDEEIAPGVTRTIDLNFGSIEAAWVRHLELAWRQAKHFVRRTKFAPSSYVDKSQALLDIAATLEQISDAIETVFAQMPTRILCRKMAILSRRLAVAALLIARSFRPGTIRRLKINWVELHGNEIRVRIPEKAFKQGGRGGSKKGVNGPLPNIPWVHAALKLWIEQGRPFLMGNGCKDDGYFITGGIVKKRGNGVKISASAMNVDALVILGYSAYEQRYLFASDAGLSGVSPDETANAMQNTRDLVRSYNKGSRVAKAKHCKKLIEFIAEAA